MLIGQAVFGADKQTDKQTRLNALPQAAGYTATALQQLEKCAVVHNNNNNNNNNNVAKEPAGLCRTNGKRPGGMTSNPWRAGKHVV